MGTHSPRDTILTKVEFRRSGKRCETTHVSPRLERDWERERNWEREREREGEERERERGREGGRESTKA